MRCHLETSQGLNAKSERTKMKTYSKIGDRKTFYFYKNRFQGVLNKDLPQSSLPKVCVSSEFSSLTASNTEDGESELKDNTATSGNDDEWNDFLNSFKTNAEDTLLGFSEFNEPDVVETRTLKVSGESLHHDRWFSDAFSKK